ncbi:MAG TPA: amylo-alpha-1,6-glucosidase [Oligoflexus sp.]|uniref:amylo-alpha-1,6-glucosidase n=1 Tax=Oligoflexus sp. TaxID=1971216 RepID=UPI002D28C61E|nr:amylo-alpha-1,6-glucosidase [Oligoflexus sp.]HYX37602.1 amylo-alpha-1,6-glucosidase [Oligoflexus sp.]
MLPITKAALADLPQLLQREWLDANSRGSYSNSTILDCPTRRYHGLLVSDAGVLNEKHVFLAKLEASLSVRGRIMDLYTNKHPGSVYYPEGYSHFDSFEYDLYPVITYRAGSYLLQRSCMLLHDRDAVLVRYKIISTESVQLILRPLLAYRSHHHLQHETSDFQVKTFPDAEGHKIEPLPQKPALHMGTDRGATFYPGPFWVKQVEYVREQERGFDYQEDLFCPGLYEAVLEPDQELYLIFGFQSTPRADIRGLWMKEEQRRLALHQRFIHDGEPLAQVKFEAEKFMVQRPDGNPSIVAGYPWFGEWGRDTMIALPGLTLGRGEPERLLPIVQTYLRQAKDGLIPNYLGQGHQSGSYNSVDATFWMFSALQQYWIATRDKAGLQTILPDLVQIIDDLVQGRSHLVRVSEDGLIQAGSSQTQVTWMDATVDGVPVTPRGGYPVEINAMWMAALAFLQDIAPVNSLPGWISLLESTPAAFRKKFWLQDAGYLADCVSPHGSVDRHIRPNQIVAISLDFCPLNREEQQSVLDVVTSHLITPYGLRTLSPEDPGFIPFYQGGPKERDAAYHQGTVWPWLISPYVKAVLKIYEDPQKARNFLRRNFSALWQEHLMQRGIMGVSEIFDSLFPYKPDGCLTQAWSVAALIELLNELKAEKV